MGVFAFHLTGSSPEPAGTTVTIPGLSSDPVAETAPAPNVALPPSGSRNGGVIVTVPPPVNGPVVQDPVQKRDPEKKKDSDTKQDLDENKGPDKGPDNGTDEGFPDVEGPLKNGGDIYTMPPDVVPVPKGRSRGAVTSTRRLHRSDRKCSLIEQARPRQHQAWAAAWISSQGSCDRDSAGLP